MKIIVADDEQLTRFTIISILRELNIGNLEVVEAVTGMDLIEKAAIFQPDGAFLDIRMPGVDGLSALDQIKKKNRYIYDGATWFILTGFADFEFARKAIEVGVENFLLKPVSKKEVKQAAEKMMLAKRNHELTSMRLREAELFAFAKEISGIDDLRELSKYNFFRAWILFADYPGDNNKLIHHLHDIIRDFDSSDIVYTLAPYSDGHYYILESTKSKNRFSCDLKKIISEDSFFSESMPLTFIMTGLCDNMDLILSEMDIALKFAVNRHLVPPEAVRFLELKDLKKNPLGFLDQFWDNLASAFHLGVFEQVRDILTKKPEIIPGKVENKILIKNLRNLFGIDRDITSINDILTYISHSFDSHHNLDNVPFLVKRILDIVKTNYKEPIGIIEISEMLEVTPNYLSSIFSKAMGMPLSRYITTLKLEEAKRLLVEDGATIKSVAYKVGYSSSKTFTRIFKKIYSMSPSAYRKEYYRHIS